jgi:phosphoribosylaminoimidazole (AIR) synthetase
MGIGMVLIVRPKAAAKIKSFMKGSKIIGRIVKGTKGVEII